MEKKSVSTGDRISNLAGKDVFLCQIDLALKAIVAALSFVGKVKAEQAKVPLVIEAKFAELKKFVKQFAQTKEAQDFYAALKLDQNGLAATGIDDLSSLFVDNFEKQMACGLSIAILAHWDGRDNLAVQLSSHTNLLAGVYLGLCMEKNKNKNINHGKELAKKRYKETHAIVAQCVEQAAKMYSHLPAARAAESLLSDNFILAGQVSLKVVAAAISKDKKAKENMPSPLTGQQR